MIKRLFVLILFIGNVLSAQGILHPRNIRQAGATTGQVLEWDGTVWGPANPSGGFCEISLTDHGAVGDGVTDDTAAFTAAVAAAAEGDVVCIPPGNFLVDGIDFGNKGLKLRGGGIGVTTITRSANGTAPVIEVTPSSVKGNVEILDMTIYIGPTAPASTTAIRIDDCDRCLLDNLFIHYTGNGSPGDGINMTQTGGTFVRRVRISEAARGIFYNSDGGAITWFQDIQCDGSAGNTEWCIEIDRTTEVDTGGIWILNSHVYSGVLGGIYVHSNTASTSPVFLYIYGSTIEVVGDHALHLENIESVFTSDNRFLTTNSGSYAVFLDGTDRVDIYNSALISTSSGVFGFANTPIQTTVSSIRCSGSGGTACFELPDPGGPTSLEISDVTLTSPAVLANSTPRLEAAMTTTPNSGAHLFKEFIAITGVSGGVTHHATTAVSTEYRRDTVDTAGGGITFRKTRGGGAAVANDATGTIDFNVFDSLSADTLVARINSIAPGITAGSVSGRLSLGVTVSGAYADRLRLNADGTLSHPTPFNSATLPAGAADGSFTYCSDCNPDATCSGGGSGAFAFRIGSAWACELN